MKLVVMLPALNEEATIARVIAGIPRAIEGIDAIEVVVIDDGSSDATAERAREVGAHVVRHRVNLGVGAAFNTGIQAALDLGADIVSNIDADGQFDPADLARLVAPILRGEADFVTASRFIDPRLVPVMPGRKLWGNRRMAEIVSAITDRRFHDVSCGFRAYSRDAALRLNLMGGFTYTQETFLDLALRGLTIVEVPVKVRGEREFGSSRVAANLWTYAVRSALILFRAMRDYQPLRVFGLLAACFGSLALALALFFFGHYLYAGAFSPHIWAGFLSAFFAGLSAITIVTGLMADMFVRVRKNQEEMLYRLRGGKCHVFGPPSESLPPHPLPAARDKGRAG